MKLRPIISKLRKYLAFSLESLVVQVSALCGTYGLILTIFLILRLLFGERWFFLSIGANVLPLLTMFCIPALLVTLIGRRYRFPWALYLLPGTIAFFLWYGGNILPRPVADDPEAFEFTVVTYNIAKSYSVLTEVTNGLFDADLIGIQELPRRISGFESFAQQSGKGVYTRFPIVSEIPEAIGTPNDISAVKTEISIDGQVVSVYSLHAFRPSLTIRPFRYATANRTTDIKAVADAVSEDTNPVIVFCDCNFSDQTEDYQLLDAHLTDAWRQRGVGLGLTAIAPAGQGGFPFLLLRSDYIWHSDHFETIAIEVLPTELSDHYPVMARLRLKTIDQ